MEFSISVPPLAVGNKQKLENIRAELQVLKVEINKKLTEKLQTINNSIVSDVEVESDED